MSVTGKPIVYGMSHPKPNPKTDAIVAEVRAHAEANQANGWEIVATWSDADIAEAIGWAESLKGAIKKIRLLGVISTDAKEAKPAPKKPATVTPITPAVQVAEDGTTTVTVKDWLNRPVTLTAAPAPAPQACTEIDFAAHWAAVEAMDHTRTN